MKRTWALSFTIAAAVLGGFGIKIWRIRAQAAQEAQAQAQADRLASELAHPRDEADRAEAPARAVHRIENPGPHSVTYWAAPDTLLTELKQLRIRSDRHRETDLSAVVDRLRGLAAAGETAVPEIRSYLVQFEDVEYPLEQEAKRVAVESSGATNETHPPGRWEPGPGVRERRLVRDRLQFEFPTPPSLRLGLLQVLTEIGTPNAELVIAEVLRGTARGVEVAYITRKLQVRAPNRYREAALTAAKELLAKPPVLSGNSRFDRLQNSYLYSVLDFYHDPSFAGQAPRLLVTAAGRLDRDALDYLTKTLGRDQALPWVYQAFTNSSLTDLGDRSRLLQSALPAAGSDPYANAMVRSVLGDERVSAEIRGFVLQSFSWVESSNARRQEAVGEPMGTKSDSGQSRWAIQAKLQFLDQLRSEYSDPILTKNIERAAQELNRQLLENSASKRGKIRRDPHLH